MNRRRLSSRLSRAYFSNAPHHAAAMGGHAFMFIRDLPLGVVPSMRHQTDYSACLEPPDENREDWIMKLLTIADRYHSGGLGATWAAFVEQVTGDIAYDGEAFFEIVSSTDDDAPTTSLVVLPSGEVREQPDAFIQVIPEADRGDGPAEIVIPRASIWHVTVPSSLGTPETHRKMIADLAALSSPMPDFALNSGNMGADVGFEFGANRNSMDIAIENVTRLWGTIPSLQQIKGTTEYFFIARRVQFAHAQALLRDHILREFNALLTRLDCPSQLIVSGVPTADQLADALVKLERGEIGFTEAMASTKLD
jgi:hypothetical protein